jgi:hypothetical protein
MKQQLYTEIAIVRVSITMTAGISVTAVPSLISLLATQLQYQAKATLVAPASRCQSHATPTAGSIHANI